MKKTLVALAALAATSAFAQVSITGTLAMGYSATSAAGVDASGLGVDTSDINFSAMEDLGGGMKAEARMGITNATRTTATPVAGLDAVLALTTGFGKFSLGATEGADYLSGGVSGVAGLGMDKKVFSAKTMNDYVALDVPLTSNVKFGISYTEDKAALGLGQGVSGNGVTVGQRYATMSVTYTGGPLVVNGGYRTYTDRVSNGTTSENVMRFAASYDLGVAKLGAGYVNKGRDNGLDVKDTLIGVSVPMGALTLGAQWAMRDSESNAVVAGGTVQGTGLGLTYALSKRTSFIANYRRWDTGAAGAGVSAGGWVPTAGAPASTETNLLLSHSF